MSDSTLLDAGTSSSGIKSASTTPTTSLPSSGKTEQKEIFVHRLFDRISPRYDLFNRLSSLGLDQGWRRRAIRRLELIPGMRVLDLASGTGDLSRFAAGGIVPLGMVVACDLSYPMLKLARRKNERIPAAYWHIRGVQARAEALPFASKSFDAAMMGFALRNVSDLKTTFSEFHRVLKPGGRLCLLEFGRPEGFFLRIGHKIWLSTAVPLLGILATGAIWPFAYLRRSILQFMSPPDVLKGLREAGFTQARAEPMNGGVVFLYSAVAR